MYILIINLSSKEMIVDKTSRLRGNRNIVVKTSWRMVIGVC